MTATDYVVGKQAEAEKGFELIDRFEASFS